MTSPRSATTRFVPPDGLRFVYLGLLVLWLTFPFVIHANLAEDAVPYVVAGELAHTQPDTIYAAEARDLYDLPAPFARRSCEISPAGTDCSSLNVAFVSAPQSLPFAVLIASAGAQGGILVMRVLAALSLSGGMWVLWRRLAHRTPRAGMILVATVVLVTPFVLVPVSLGQTSPYLFLSACVGVRSTERRGLAAVLVAGLWALTISLKLFPLALLAILLWQRRFKLIALAGGWLALLTAGAVLIAPTSVFPRFVTASSLLNGYSLENPYNGSLDAILHPFIDGSSASRVLSLASFGLRVALAGALAWWALRRADDDTQWAWGWLALLLFVPLVWWHYLWIAMAALGVALAGRRHLDDRLLAILPVAAFVTVLISLPTSNGGALPVAQFAFLLAGVVGVAWIARGEPARPRSEHDAVGVT